MEAYQHEIDDLVDDGAAPSERSRCVPELAEDVALARVVVKIEDLASPIRAERYVAERWMADRGDEPGGIEWCAYALGIGADSLAAEMRKRAAEKREARRAHRAHLREVRSATAELPL